MALGDSQQEQLQRCIDRHRDRPGALLPLLHDVQAELGYVPDEAVPTMAEALHLSRAEVHGVLSFYHDFRREPGGRHRLQICRAEACQAMGARELEAHARSSLGLEFGETSSDGALTLEAVYCLGNCACSPSIRLDDEIYARVDARRLDALLADLRQGGEE